MLERSTRNEGATAAPPVPLGARQALFFTLVGLSLIGLVWLCVVALSVDGFGPLDCVLVALFAVTLPWTVISFWNATIGLLIMRFAPDPVVAVLPIAARVRGDEPITASTAILVCIRNEPPAQVTRCLAPMMQGLTGPGVGERFHLFERFFGPHHGALGSIGGSPGGQFQTHQENDLLTARQDA